MSVLIDTSVWSLAIRRRRRDLSAAQREIVHRCRELVREKHATLIGMIRQEVLSGVKDESLFEEIRGYLRCFEDETVTTADHERAARFFNRCRSRGVAGSPVDMLVCAVAFRCGFEIFTIDDDFRRYAEHLPIALHSP